MELLWYAWQDSNPQPPRPKFQAVNISNYIVLNQTISKPITKAFIKHLTICILVSFNYIKYHYISFIVGNELEEMARIKTKYTGIYYRDSKTR